MPNASRDPAIALQAETYFRGTQRKDALFPVREKRSILERQSTLQDVQDLHSLICIAVKPSFLGATKFSSPKRLCLSGFVGFVHVRESAAEMGLIFPFASNKVPNIDVTQTAKRKTMVRKLCHAQSQHASRPLRQKLGIRPDIYETKGSAKWSKAARNTSRKCVTHLEELGRNKQGMRVRSCFDVARKFGLSSPPMGKNIGGLKTISPINSQLSPFPKLQLLDRVLFTPCREGWSESCQSKGPLFGGVPGGVFMKGRVQNECSA